MFFSLILKIYFVNIKYFLSYSFLACSAQKVVFILLLHCVITTLEEGRRRLRELSINDVLKIRKVIKLVICVGCIRLNLTFSHGKLNANFGKFNFFEEEDDREV